MNSIGNCFVISIFGASHGEVVGVMIDGVPAGIALKEEDFIEDLSRRKPSHKATTSREESDTPMILSGVYNDFTTGMPITIVFKNSNTRAKDYADIQHIPRPGHADFVANKKYHGFNDHRGGGVFSGRMTVALVAAGVVAKKMLDPMHIEAKINTIGGEKNYEKLLDDALKSEDSLGGEISCIVSGVTVGLGEPFFNSVESVISHLIFSIPGVKGVAFGAGFKAVEMKGSDHNDSIKNQKGKTTTNHSGGINGGITNGNEVQFSVAVKPTSTITKEQQSFDFDEQHVTSVTYPGRHDTCFALRIPVVIEAVTAIALADLTLMK